MEQLLRKTKKEHKDAFSDPSNRMPQRPLAVRSGEGVGFQELGSSFGPPKTAVRTYGKASKAKAKPIPPIPRKEPPPISEDESDDELLLSSQTSMAGDASPSSKRAAKGKKHKVPSSDHEIVLVDGRPLKAHPDYKPSSANALKGLRFSKNKMNTFPGDAEADVPPPSSSLTASQDLWKPISDAIEIVDGSPPAASPSRKKPSGTRLRSPSATRPGVRQLPKAKGFSDFKSPPSTVRDTPQSPAKPRPRPRLVMKPAARKPESSSESTPRPEARNFPLCSNASAQPTNTEGKFAIKKSVFPSPPRREPQEFPMSLQAKENVSDGSWSGDAYSSRMKKASLTRSATFVHAPKPIPLPSPLRTKPVSRATTFPNLSPLSSSPNDNGKARAKCPNEDNHGLRGRAGPRPFPMSSQMLAGIDRRSNSPSLKRTSSDDSSTEQGRNAKKRKDSRSAVLDSFDYLNEPMEDDSIELGYARDPSTLCPYCDEGLPSHPTPHLRQLLAMARKKSVPDPRPRNRGGLKAPLTIYISVCQRHRFESHQLPIAAERGWPKTIDFNKVPARVKRMKKELEAIILDSDDISDTENLDTDDRRRGPRHQSVFWREVKKEVKKQGSRTVVGVKGQYASFEKTQPGYYGEQGSVIIHQTLFDLFPPSTFDASLISPLAPAEFIQRILVPEAAVRLIVQDLCVDMEDAVVTLRDSAQYGVAMFPDTSENKRKGTGAHDDEMGVADQIVMERARARRKELAEEEEVEKAMLEEQRAAHRAKAWESRREKAMERAQLVKQGKVLAEGVMNVEAAEVSEADEPRGTRRGTKQRAVSDDWKSDAMSVDSLASRGPAHVAKKAGRSDAGKTARATPQPNGLDDDSVEVVDDPKRKSSIRASKTKEHTTQPDTRVGIEASAPRDRKKPFGGFIALDSDDEHESTPRPARQRATNAGTSGNAVDGSRARICPLQVARNRSGARPLTTHDGWSRSLRTDAPDGADSDASNASRRSQRLNRPAIKKGGSYSWLISDLSSCDSS